MRLRGWEHLSQCSRLWVLLLSLAGRVKGRRDGDKVTLPYLSFELLPQHLLMHESRGQTYYIHRWFHRDLHSAWLIVDVKNMNSLKKKELILFLFSCL